MRTGKSFILALLFVVDCAQTFAYDDGIRIAWDYGQRVFHNGGTYARIKKLQNNDLALVYSFASDVYIRKQTAGNKQWDNARLVAKDGSGAYNYTNSELIELKDGRLLYAWNARPKEGTDKPYKIMISMSDDGGVTWHSEQDLFVAGITSREGCWEPYFLLLPSGEVQLYFANEYKVADSFQNISIMRSSDNGETWQTPEVVSYREGSRDGMPVAVYLQNNKGIALAIEDNGINGAFKPVIVHTDAADNWESGVVEGNSPKRRHALRSDYQLPANVYGGAPYLIQLSSGETVLSFQSQEGRTNGSSHEYANMQVYIGNDEAKDFSRKSTPFPYLNSSQQALWNSLCQTSDSTVVAVASITGLSQDNGVWSVTGKIMQPMKSEQAVNGSRDWTKPVPLFIGAESRTKAEVRSMWDNDSLYFHFNVTDYKQIGAEEGTALWDSDAIEIYLDPKGITVNTLVSGLYKILVNVENKKLLNRTSGTNWIEWKPKINSHVTVNGPINYSIEVSVPWDELIGGKPEKAFGVHFKLHNSNGNNNTITHENLSGSHPDRPRTWMKCSLNPTTSSAYPIIKSEHHTLLTLYPNHLKRGESFCVKLPEELSDTNLTIYNLVDGKTVYHTVMPNGGIHQVTGIDFSGTAIAVAETSSGKRFYNKLIIH